MDKANELKYKHLVDLKINHGFYNERITDELDLVPVGSSAKVLKQLGMIFKQKNGTLSLYGKDASLLLLESLIEDQSSSERKTSSLDFMITASSTMMSVTENAPIAATQVLYCSNLPCDKANKCYLKPSSVNTLSKVSLTSTNAQTPPSVATMNHIPLQSFSNDSLALIRLHIPSLLKSITKAKTSLDFRFFIDGISRPWKYLISAKYADKLAIHDSDNHHKFAHLRSESVGKSHFESFVSDKAIALKQRYEIDFQLKHVNKKTSKPDLVKLPGASPKYFGFENINGEQTAVSEIMVSLT